MSNVPALQITPEGVTTPDSVTIRNGVLADENIAFGGDLDITTPSTPQAYLADQLTSNISDANAAVTYYVSQVDPATAEGRMQDAIARIYFLSRNGATSSVVIAQCTGQPGASLPAGSLAQDDSNNLWQSTDTALFPTGGVVSVQFVCLTLGPVQLGIGALTRIAQTSPGWDAITNLQAATVGSNVETRAAFEQRRQESVAINSKGTPAAIRSAIWDVPGVIDVFVYDNYTNATINYGATAFPIVAHSVYVGVSGGSDAEIGKAIFSRKDLGCDMNGNTSVTIQDTDGYEYPYPSYVYKFQRLASLPVLVAVQLANNSSLPGNIVALTKAAIIATFNGVDGSQRTRAGGQIFASNFYAGVAGIGASVSIIQIKIGTSTPTLDSISVGIDQSPTIQESNITVTLV